MDRSGFEPEASCLRSAKILPRASKYMKELKRWMDQKGFSLSYRSEIKRYLKPLEDRDISGIYELREIIQSSPSNMILTVIRAYINFLLDNEIISDDTAMYFRKALPSMKSATDSGTLFIIRKL